jgi:hypothetical protein
MESEIWLVFQLLVKPETPSKLRESPWQKMLGPLGVICAVGLGFTVTITVFEESLHPFKSVPQTRTGPELLMN